MSWLVPRSELTPDQLRAVNLGAETHRLIVGPPGSGKTMVLLHRARHLADDFSVPPDRWRLFMFTNSLKTYVQSALDDLSLPNRCVLTFDAWCMEYYRAHVGGRLPWNSGPDFKAIRRTVQQFLAERRTNAREYDYVLVDEGQDLDEDAYRILDSVAAHVTVCMDQQQQLYEDRADEVVVLRALRLKRRNVSLLDAYRCSPHVVRVAAAFISDEQERDEFIAQNPPLPRGERRKPVLSLAEDHDGLLEDLADSVRACQADNERVAILLPTRKQVFGYGKRLMDDYGLQVEVPPQRGKRKLDLPPHDFASSVPKAMAYPSAKGLTFDSVLMPAITPRSLPNDIDRAARWLFVGATRATRWAYFSAVDQRCIFRDRFEALERQGQLTIKSPTTSARPQAAPDRDVGSDDLSELF